MRFELDGSKGPKAKVGKNIKFAALKHLLNPLVATLLWFAVHINKVAKTIGLMIFRLIASRLKPSVQPPK